MSNIVEDFLLLRKQVDVALVDDARLKRMFKDNNYDMVNTILQVEKECFNHTSYLEQLPKKSKTEAQEKIDELRVIVQEKDAIMEKIQISAGI